MEMLGRYEENAYFYRMLKVAGHPDVRLMELDGYGQPPKNRFIRYYSKRLNGC